MKAPDLSLVNVIVNTFHYLQIRDLLSLELESLELRGKFQVEKVCYERGNVLITLHVSHGPAVFSLWQLYTQNSKLLGTARVANCSI